MELREWLIILGLALVTLIVVDGVRRLQRQRRIPRLDEVDTDARDTSPDPEEQAREAEINWELPNGGARVVRPADYSRVQPKPKLVRQEHPGPSRVLAAFKSDASRTGDASSNPDHVGGASEGVGSKRSGFDSGARGAADESVTATQRQTSNAADRQDRPDVASRDAGSEAKGEARSDVASDAGMEERLETRTPRTHSEDSDAGERLEPSMSALDDASGEAKRFDEPLMANPEDHDEHHDAERYRLVDLDGMSDSFKDRSRRVGSSMQRFGASMRKTMRERSEQKRAEKARRETERAEKAARDAEQRRLARERAEAERAEREEERLRLEAEAIEAADDHDPLFAPPRERETHGQAEAEAPARDADKVRVHPVLERALRHDVSAEQARHALSHADEIIVISVMCREPEGFSGTALLDLMLACGLRYSSDMGIFHRFETEDADSPLQFSMVNVLKPGTFPIEAMDDFRTSGVTLLMPLPGASDTAAAFEAMVETAMVIVRHLGGELKDENLSVMTAQTVGFARQRVQEFERRNRLNRYQVN